tara:strand:+ start:105 stop:314 length:210 start_codon:yes stop_codon:yes gene_type:complete
MNNAPMPTGTEITYTTRSGTTRTATIAYWYRHPATNGWGAVLDNGSHMSGLDTNNPWLGGGNAQPVTIN